MSYLTVNSRAISQARVTFPLTGAWHADLFVAGAETISGACTIDLGGALTLTGTAIVSGNYTQAAHVRVLAGKGAWQSPCSPRFWQGATLGTILGSTLSALGETLSSTADATAKGVSLPAFAVTAASLGANVRALMAYAPAGTSWRFLPDGTFWIGPETWGAFGEDYQVTSEEPRERRLDVGFQVPTLQAGQTVEAESGTVRVNRVESKLSVDGFSARAWWQPS